MSHRASSVRARYRLREPVEPIANHSIPLCRGTSPEGPAWRSAHETPAAARRTAPRARCHPSTSDSSFSIFNSPVQFATDSCQRTRRKDARPRFRSLHVDASTLPSSTRGASSHVAERERPACATCESPARVRTNAWRILDNAARCIAGTSPAASVPAVTVWTDLAGKLRPASRCRDGGSAAASVHPAAGGTNRSAFVNPTAQDPE